MIETLAERTLALLHAAKRAGGSGYWDKLADRLQGPAAGLRQARNETRHQWRRRGAGGLRRDDRTACARAAD